MEADAILSVTESNYALSPKQSFIATAMTLLAVFLFSCISALTQKGSNLGFSAAELLLYRSLVQLIVAIIYGLCYLFFHKCLNGYRIVKSRNAHSSHPSSSLSTLSINEDTTLQVYKYSFYEWTLLIFRGFFGAISTASIIYAISYLCLADAVTLCCLSPLLILVSEKIFFTEEDFAVYSPMCSVEFILSSVFAITGIFLIVEPSDIAHFDTDTKCNNNNRNGIIWALAGSLMSAVTRVTLKKGLNLGKEIPSGYWLCSHCIVCSVFGIIMAKMEDINNLHDHMNNNNVGESLLVLISMGVLSFFAQLLLTKYIRFITPKIAIFSVEFCIIMFSYFWQIFLFDIKPRLFAILGVFFIVVAIALSYYDLHNKIQRIMQIRKDLTENLIGNNNVNTVVQNITVITSNSIDNALQKIKFSDESTDDSNMQRSSTGVSFNMDF